MYGMYAETFRLVQGLQFGFNLSGIPGCKPGIPLVARSAEKGLAFFSAAG